MATLRNANSMLLVTLSMLAGKFQQYLLEFRACACISGWSLQRTDIKIFDEPVQHLS